MSTVNGGWRGSNIVKDGLLLYLDAGSPNSYFSSTSGTTWRDISGNGNNATINKLNSSQPIFNSADGGSIILNRIGTLSGDRINNSNSFNLTTEVTLDCWFKTPLNVVQIVAGKGFQGAIIEQSFTIFLVNNVAYGRITTGGGGDDTNITTTITINAWNNLTLTYNGSNMFLYRNGTLASSSVKTGLMSNNFPFIIGAQFNNSSGATTDFFGGDIGQVKLYNRALSSSEVSQNFQVTRSRFGI